MHLIFLLLSISVHWFNLTIIIKCYYSLILTDSVSTKVIINFLFHSNIIIVKYVIYFCHTQYLYIILILHDAQYSIFFNTPIVLNEPVKALQIIFLIFKHLYKHNPYNTGHFLSIICQNKLNVNKQCQDSLWCQIGILYSSKMVKKKTT